MTGNLLRFLHPFRTTIYHVSKNIGQPLVLIFFVLTNGHLVFAQSYLITPEKDLKLNMISSLAASEPDYAATVLNYEDEDYVTEPLYYDSVSAAVKPRLLPEKISFAEKLLWGEDGLVRKSGIASPLTRDVRIHELDVRRTMLTAHTIGGFTTLALMLTTAYLGQKAIDGGNRNYRDLHQTFAAVTILSYSATGLLAVLSPPPLIRRDEESTTTLHKTLAWVHLAGMIVTPILGSLVTNHRHLNIDKAHYHQYAGYITTAVFTASMIVITF